MSQVTRPPEREDVGLGRALRHGWWLPLIGILLGLGVGLTLLSLLPATYRASTRLVVTPMVTMETMTSSTGVPAEVNLDTEAQVVSSLAVADKAAELLKTSLPPEQLVRSVTVSVPPNSDVLEISFDAPTPAEARDGAQAFAEAYLQTRRESVSLQADQQKSDAAATVRDLQPEVRALSREIATNSRPARDLRLRSALQLVQQRLERAQSLLSDLDTAGMMQQPGQVLSPATTPSAPQFPQPYVLLVSTLALGLLSGAVGAWVTRDRREVLVHPLDVERLTGHAVLGVCDERDLGDVDADPRLVGAARALARQRDHFAVATAGGSSTSGPAVALGLARQLQSVAAKIHPVVVSVGTDRTVATLARRLGVDARTAIAAEEAADIVDELRQRNAMVLLTGGGRDFWKQIRSLHSAVVVVTAGRTTVYDLRNTLARIENSGTAVAGIVIERASRSMAEPRRSDDTAAHSPATGVVVRDMMPPSTARDPVSRPIVTFVPPPPKAPPGLEPLQEAGPADRP